MEGSEENHLFGNHSGQIMKMAVTSVHSQIMKLAITFIHILASSCGRALGFHRTLPLMSDFACFGCKQGAAVNAPVVVVDVLRKLEFIEGNLTFRALGGAGSGIPAGFFA